MPLSKRKYGAIYFSGQFEFGLFRNIVSDVQLRGRTAGCNSLRAPIS